MLKKFMVALFCLAMAGTAASQAMLGEKLYDTGTPLKKPMVMEPFVEFQTARKLPKFELKTLDGQPVNLADYHGKLLILNIWATWCLPCIREIPMLIDLQKKLEGTDVVLMGVAVDENPSTLKPFFKKYGFQGFKTWMDPDLSVDNAMPISTVPTNYFLDGSGNLIGFFRGYISWDEPDIGPILEKLA
ncbi:MAG: TlpA family protein disulfide reductase, partial [Burkholderiales bacterium]|nr:TlpA family protein disulfide reductase [Burkholderiales bacterium]